MVRAPGMEEFPVVCVCMCACVPVCVCMSVCVCLLYCSNQRARANWLAVRAWTLRSLFPLITQHGEGMFVIDGTYVTLTLMNSIRISSELHSYICDYWLSLGPHSSYKFQNHLF